MPILMKRCLFSSSNRESTFEALKFKVGEVERLTFSDSNVWLGLNPKYLNANGNLDTIVCQLK